MSFMVFVIHTVPDTQTGAHKYQLGDLDEKNAIKAMLHLQQQSGKPELPHFLQRIVGIASLYRGPGVTLQMNYFGQDDKDNSELNTLDRFFKTINPNNIPTFVCWDAENDFSLLHYRCLKHEIPLTLLTRSAPVSLQEAIGGYQDNTDTTLENIMHLLGLEARASADQQQIWHDWQQQDYTNIRKSCIDKVLDTYQIYIRYQYIMGEVTLQHYQHETNHINRFIAQHLEKYYTAE